MTDKPLWIPSPERVAATQVMDFMRQVNDRHGLSLTSYKDLHAWSVAHPGLFWDQVWDYCGVIGDKGGRRLIDGDRMPGAQFFPDASINFAENLLRKTGSGDAMVFRGEDKVSYRLTWDDVHALVSRAQQALKAAGVGKGDRVAAMLPNLPESVALMLAVTSIGAIWSSCSPDFGERGVLDRFGQIEPKVFLAVDGYWYNGKAIDLTDRLTHIAGQLPTAQKVIIVPYLKIADKVAAAVPRAVTLEAFLAPFTAKPVIYERVPFNHPVYILYSSGTTGVPKCIVHGGGGTLLQHLKEHRLQSDVREGDRVFYFTTLGWMMWNWLVSGIGAGATLILWDGSPFAPKPDVLFEYAQDEKITLFGTSAKYIDALKKADVHPAKTHDLSSVRVMTSTGSPLAAESFDYVYSDIKSDLHLASISGGTDIVSCFVLGDPTAPVYRGEIQAAGLGMAVDVWSDDGQHIEQEKGELVCTRPFTSMPVMFWNDPDGKKYRAAYFERFPNVWCHGDFAEWTKHGGLIIHGRSDATLNPGGVRIGTAEIYAQVEQIPEVLEAIAIGQDFDNDVRVVLFVRCKEGVTLDDNLRDTIKKKIRTGASPRHVPAKIIQIADIPRTKSGKITELAVRDVVHGRAVKNTEALANPEALKLYEGLAELRT
ncbi:acetoacetate--CoA ligase [Pseudorhodoplanes sinuspersici]|uniref:Acetoacetate--CoA ligase n=1 Tax=Pseudorhodoplanes sinuspersici TaxID=1235591 RepID=A0A1W6ZLS7_9HYPH|nr:acetoacetate--CoA ligase [Pseudorhodoplanes sinuspersici]ARP98309.1 acetoacetate--CoA ligase [Pseudorhodoplanes sinuspersici]RKE65964.1 acetoacetyl-CoA synthetase [Pseudorhodoplanes sinuspersici]